MNAFRYGYTGNEIHAYMDRAAKELRQNHREVGHDFKALLVMQYNPMVRKLHKLEKYTPTQVWETWLLHKMMDAADSSFGTYVKNKVKGYGRKESLIEALKRLKQEVMRL